MTPEASALKHVRKRLRDVCGFPKSRVHAQAYWSAGREMGVSRDTERAAQGETSVIDHREPENVAVQSQSLSDLDEVGSVASRGSWGARAVGRLRAGLRSALIVSGVHPRD